MKKVLQPPRALKSKLVEAKLQRIIKVEKNKYHKYVSGGKR